MNYSKVPEVGRLQETILYVHCSLFLLTGGQYGREICDYLKPKKGETLNKSELFDLFKFKPILYYSLNPVRLCFKRINVIIYNFFNGYSIRP